MKIWIHRLRTSTAWYQCAACCASTNSPCKQTPSDNTGNWMVSLRCGFSREFSTAPSNGSSSHRTYKEVFSLDRGLACESGECACWRRAYGTQDTSVVDRCRSCCLRDASRGSFAWTACRIFRRHRGTLFEVSLCGRIFGEHASSLCWQIFYRSLDMLKRYKYGSVTVDVVIRWDFLAKTGKDKKQLFLNVQGPWLKWEISCFLETFLTHFNSSFPLREKKATPYKNRVNMKFKKPS